MSNYYWHYINGQKVCSKQVQGDSWSIRKSLHKATVSGVVRLPERKTVKLAIALKDIHQICNKKKRHIIQDVIKSYSHYDEKTILKYFKDRKYIIEDCDFSKLEIYTLPQEAKWAATRINIDTSFDQKAINSITDSGVRNILSSHLKKYNDANGKEHPEKAFSPEGLQDMNLHLKELNQGKAHKPILKVRKYEALGNKFNIGIWGSKDKKYVEADKGTNLFFAIYEDEEDNRTYDSIPFNIAVEHLKNLENIAPQRKEDGSKLLFTLSPNDLVYLPEEGEHVDKNQLDKNKIYKFVSCTGNRAYFIPENVANIICDKQEYTQLNKEEFNDQHICIKQFCIKIQIDQLGNLTSLASL
jgi:CRISPR-associated endonuclease Csn1